MRMKHSRSSVQFRPYDDSIAEHMKYSESMSTLKQMRDADEESKNRPTSSIFKKGTSDFIKRKILSNVGKKTFETGDFQK